MVVVGVERGGDACGRDGAVVVVVTWRRVVGGDVAFAGGVGIDELPRIGPKVGIHWGARRRRWQPRVMVVVVGDGGGSGKRWGTSQCVTFVTFQPRLLDLATHRRLLIINGNYY
jgi:hypothetical protein